MGEVKAAVPAEPVLTLAVPPVTMPLHVPVTMALDFTVPLVVLIVTTALAPERVRDMVMADTKMRLSAVTVMVRKDDVERPPLSKTTSEAWQVPGVE